MFTMTKEKQNTPEKFPKKILEKLIKEFEFFILFKDRTHLLKFVYDVEKLKKLDFKEVSKEELNLEKMKTELKQIKNMMDKTIIQLARHLLYQEGKINLYHCYRYIPLAILRTALKTMDKTSTEEWDEPLFLAIEHWQESNYKYKSQREIDNNSEKLAMR